MTACKVVKDVNDKAASGTHAGHQNATASKSGAGPFRRESPRLTTARRPVAGSARRQDRDLAELPELDRKQPSAAAGEPPHQAGPAVRGRRPLVRDR